MFAFCHDEHSFYPHVHYFICDLLKEIANEIMNMGVKGVLVVAEGEHLCMKMRGVRNGSLIMTMAYRGVLQQKELRENLLSLLYTPKPELHSI